VESTILETNNTPAVTPHSAGEMPDHVDYYTVILHVGKCGGSSVKAGLEAYLDPRRASIANHAQSRQEMAACADNPGRRFSYFVRDPVTRYVSGWIEAYRLGWPDYFRLLRFGELLAFMRFHSPNDLACALSSNDLNRQQAAQRAMHAIEHVQWGQADYWDGLENFGRCIGSQFFVGRTENFGEDYRRLVNELDSSGALLDSSMSRVPPEEHVMPDKYLGWKYLGDCAINNLRSWYHDDFVLISNLTQHGLLPESYIAEIHAPYPIYASGVNRLSMSTTWYLVGFLSFLAFVISFSIDICFCVYGWRRDPAKPPHSMRVCSITSFVLFLACCVSLVLFLTHD
jgi:hypothetical protein